MVSRRLGPALMQESELYGSSAGIKLFEAIVFGVAARELLADLNWMHGTTRRLYPAIKRRSESTQSSAVEEKIDRLVLEKMEGGDCETRGRLQGCDWSFIPQKRLIAAKSRHS